MADLLQRRLFFVFVCCLLQSLAAQTPDYCDPDLCHGSEHVACNNTGEFGAECSADAKIIPIDDTLQLLIITKHNELRNLVAMGKLKGFQPAIRMATMEWDDELAKLAVLNIKQCKMKHDQCRSTAAFRHSGQNLAHIAWMGMDFTVEDNIKNGIQMWFDEYKAANMKDIKKLESHKTRQIGHFTGMMLEKNNHVGCALLRQTSNPYYEAILTCNYAYINILSHAVYRDGPTASKCTTGKNPKFPGLCSTKEKYNVNELSF